MINLDCIIFGLQTFGGISNYWAHLVNYVVDEPSLSSKLLLPGSLAYREFDPSWTVRSQTSSGSLNARVARYLPVSNDRDCIFHTSYYRLPRHRVDKYVVSVYDFTYERFVSGFSRHVHSKQKFGCIQRSDAVLCISESTRRDVIEFCPNVDPSILHVIHLGVDTRVFYPDQVGLKSVYDQTVLFVGQRLAYKRFDLAIEAVRASPRLTLGVVGPPLTAKERTLLSARLGFRWHELGPVPASELRRLYSSAFAFIFPSDYEGFGLPILEAMACGCPVVASSLSSFPEVGGTAAHYAEMQDGESYASKLSVLDLVDERQVSVRAGLARAAQFDWRHTFERTKAVYSDL